MIIISGNTYDITEIIYDYNINSIERQLLNTMSNSAEKYRYDNLDQLKFELMLRREIANSARELNNSKFSFATFHKSRCNPAYWNRTNNGGFQLKTNASPSAAIRDIFINGHLYANECATAMIIVYYKALLNVFGDNLFDKSFPKIYMMNWHFIDPLLREVGTPKKVADILIGDRGYVANPDVDPRSPEWQGENVIVLPGGLNYGHGIGIATVDRIISILNSRRKRGATRSAYFMDSTSRPNFNRLAKLYYS